MQIGGVPLKVELKVDLTKYDERCSVGQIGETVPNHSFSSFGNFDDFVAVRFENGAEMDVAYSSLNLLNAR